MASLTIRDLEEPDEEDWRDLWAAYCRFYEVKIPKKTTDATWTRLIQPDGPIHGLIAVSGRQKVGILNYVLHPYTWGTGPACYLEDLYVSMRHRGRGTGRALIEHLKARADDRQWDRVYWFTKETNYPARTLYDSLARKSDFIRYDLDLG